MVKFDNDCFKKGGWFSNFFGNLFKILIIVLIIGLLIIILRELYTLFNFVFISPIDILINKILFIFILIELFTILIGYLRTEFIKVERIIEVGIISLVRDIIFHFSDIDNGKLYGISAILLVFGIIFFIEKYYSKERNLN